MRRLLTGLAVATAVAATVVPVTPAAALPPDCEEHADKPCIVLCEILGPDWYRPVQMLLENAPPKPFC